MRHRLEFSEFTYGYALTENLGRLSAFSAAPIFPSLNQEGTDQGGYDLQFGSAAGVPMLVQFKVPQVMSNGSSLKPSDFSLPYYRAHLRCRINDEGFSQHSALLAHEDDGAIVYYAAPRFHTRASLDEHFLVGNVVAESAFFTPGDVGVVSDAAHHVAYCRSVNVGWLRSDPVKLPRDIDSTRFLNAVTTASRKRGNERIDFETLLAAMVRAAEKAVAPVMRPRRVRSVSPVDAEPGARDSTLQRKAPVDGKEDEISRDQERPSPRLFASRLLEGRSPAVAAALFARLWLNAELFIIGPANPESR